MATPSWTMYLRKSRDKAEQADPDILAKHRAQLLHRAADLGIRVPSENVFEEIGSGEYITQRPAFRRLLAHWQRIPAGSSGGVLVMETSRLSRGISAERGIVQAALVRAGVHVITPHRIYDLSQDEDEVWYEIQGVFDRAELLRYKRRVKDAKETMLREGKLRNAAVPYGYVYSKDAGRPHRVAGIPVPDPTRFPILKALCRDALKESTRALAERYGLRQWEILRALRSPVICGYTAQVKAPRPEAEPGSRQYRYLPRDEQRWSEVPGPWEAAITREEFLRIQQVLIARRREKPSIQTDGWCRDLVTFLGHEAEPAPVRLGTISHPNQSLAVYEQPRRGAPRLYVPRQVVNAAVAADLPQQLRRPEVLARCIIRFERYSGSQSGPDDGALAALRERLVQCRRLADELLRREILATEAGEAASIARVRLETLADEKRLEQALARAQSDAGQLQELDSWVQVLPGIVDDLEACWEEAEPAQRRLMVNAFVERVVVRAEPVGTGQAVPWRREVEEVVYQPWVRAL